MATNKDYLDFDGLGKYDKKIKDFVENKGYCTVPRGATPIYKDEGDSISLNGETHLGSNPLYVSEIYGGNNNDVSIKGGSDGCVELVNSNGEIHLCGDGEIRLDGQYMNITSAGDISVTGDTTFESNVTFSKGLGSVSLDKIYGAAGSECGGDIVFTGGNRFGVVEITAEGEDGTPSIKMTGSSSDTDSIQLYSNNIKFNNVEVPKDKTGTIALLSDITGVTNAVTYETGSVTSTMDMKSVENASGERVSKAACFGSFDDDVGDEIGVGSDGVYLYMPWSGKSMSYGHIIAGDDSINDGDGSLFHTALSGDDDEDVPSFRKILDSSNYTSYVSGKAPYGFNYVSSATWGNQTGTYIADWSDGSGGDIQFRKNNPSSGQTSIIADGTVYVNEGYDRVLAKMAQSISSQGNYQSTYSNYLKLDNGMMIAWGRMYSSGGDMTIAFPTSFNDTPLVVVSPVYNHTAYVGYATETYCGVRVESPAAYEVGGYLNWIAIGRVTART